MRRRAVLLLGTAVGCAGSGNFAHPEVDSAAVARTAWNSTLRTYRAGFLDSAADYLDRATSAWPIQPAYHRSRALLALERNDTETLLSSVRALVTLESGGDLLRDTTLERVAQADSEIARAMADLSVVLAPVSRSETWAILSDSTLFAEGIAAAPGSGVTYVTSIRHRTVYEVDRSGVVRDLELAADSGVGAVMGVAIDPVRNVLWVTTAFHPAALGGPRDSSHAALFRIDPVTGTIRQRWDLAADRRMHIPGAVAVTSTGDVLVTDSREPWLYRLRPGNDTLERFTHRLFRSLQGIALPPAGEVAFLADYSHGILRLDLASNEVTRVREPTGAGALGLDGLVWWRDRLVGIQNGVTPPRVVEIQLDGSGAAITRMETLDRNWPLADEPTNLTVRNGQLLYIANSQWEKYDPAGKRRPGTRLAPTVLLAAPFP